MQANLLSSIHPPSLIQRLSKIQYTSFIVQPISGWMIVLCNKNQQVSECFLLKLSNLPKNLPARSLYGRWLLHASEAKLLPVNVSSTSELHLICFHVLTF